MIRNAYTIEGLTPEEVTAVGKLISEAVAGKEDCWACHTEPADRAIGDTGLCRKCNLRALADKR